MCIVCSLVFYHRLPFAAGIYREYCLSRPSFGVALKFGFLDIFPLYSVHVRPLGDTLHTFTVIVVGKEDLESFGCGRSLHFGQLAFSIKNKIGLASGFTISHYAI